MQRERSKERMQSGISGPTAPTPCEGGGPEAVSQGVWVWVPLEGLTKGPHTLSGSGVWTLTRKLFYLQHPGRLARPQTSSPDLIPSGGPTRKGKGGGNLGTGISLTSPQSHKSVGAISHVALPQPPLRPHLG